jgi:hypothetical protein
MQQMKSWAVELTSIGLANAASVDDCAAGVVIAAATAASPSAASATSTAALGPAPSALSTDPDAGCERTWKNLYFKL